MGGILFRLSIFWRQLILLWRAFWHKKTPFYLKILMVGIVVYLISPFDILPDFILGLGLVDDILLLALAVNWIVRKIPREIFYKSQTTEQPDFDDGSDDATIDGTSRRL